MQLSTPNVVTACLEIIDTDGVSRLYTKSNIVCSLSHNTTKMAPPPSTATSSDVAVSPSHQEMEDAPVEYLEGCMEILVVFPNEKIIPMSIQRR